MRSAPIRILCVDDHAVVREGLAAIIRHEPDMELVASADDGIEGVNAYRQRQPDVVLMDLGLPNMSGVEAIRSIRRMDGDARIIVLTVYQGDRELQNALEAGAARYLLKDTLADDLIVAIREVCGEPAGKTHAGVTAAPELTSRERDVVRLLAQGKRNKEIAGNLGIAQQTVQAHIKSIFLKLGVHDRTAALAVALRRGIAHLD